MRTIFASAIAMIVFSGLVAAQESTEVDDAVSTLIKRIKALEPPIWSYADLRAKSDLVVIGTVIESKIVADRSLEGLDYASDVIDRVANKVKVLSVLKGDATEEVEIITSRYKAGVAGLARNDFGYLRKTLLVPNIVSVVIDNEIVDVGTVEDSKPERIIPEYLIYLKRTDQSGVYVPTTGQQWGGISIKLISSEY